MSGSIGVMFNVGASVNRTVGGAFATVRSRVSGLRTELSGLERQSTAATRLITSQTRLQTVQERFRADPSEATRTAMQTVAREYHNARRAAGQYGITVGNVAQAQTALTRTVADTRTALGRQVQMQANQAKRKELQNDILGTVGMAMTVAAPIKVAIEYEADFADLKKVANFANAEQEKQVQQDIFNASRRTGIDASGMTKIAAAAGESGVVNDAEGNLDAEKTRQFLNDAAEMAVAYGISAEEAGNRLAIFQSRLSEDGMALTAAQTKELGDSMNYVASKMNATAADTSSVVARMGGVGSMAGLSAKSVAGLAAALVSTSENKETAGTAMKSFLLTLAQGDKMTKQQKDAFSQIGIHNVQAIAEGIKRGGPEAENTIMSVLAAMKDLPEAEQAGIAKEIFGTENLGSLAPLINDISKLKKAFALANSPEAAGSQLREFETRSKTTAGAIDRLKASTGILGITVGSVLLPAVANTAEFFTAVITPVTALATKCPLLTQTIMTLGVGLVALKVSALAGGYAVTILSDGWNIAKGILNFFRPSVLATNAALVRHKVVAFGAAVGTRIMATGAKIAAAGTWLLNAAMTANPIGLVIVGLTALGAGMVYLYNTCEPVRVIFDKVFSYIGEKFDWVCEKFKTVKGWIGLVDEEDSTPDDEESATGNVTGAANTATPPVRPVARTERVSNWYTPFSQRGGGEEATEAPESKAQTVARPTASLRAEPPVTATPTARTEPVGAAVKPTQPVVKTEKVSSWYTPFSRHDSGEQTTEDSQTRAEPAAHSAAPLRTEPPVTATPTARTESTRTAIEPTRTAAAQSRKASVSPDSSSAASLPATQKQSQGKGAGIPAMPGQGVNVNLALNVAVNGVPDADFSKRVITSLNQRQGEFQKIVTDFVSGIVSEQRRLSYGA